MRWWCSRDASTTTAVQFGRRSVLSKVHHGCTLNFAVFCLQLAHLTALLMQMLLPRVSASPYGETSSFPHAAGTAGKLIAAVFYTAFLVERLDAPFVLHRQNRSAIGPCNQIPFRREILALPPLNKCVAKVTPKSIQP